MFGLKHRRGSQAIGQLFEIAIFIVVGVLLFVNVYTELDDQRDADWSATANASIAGVETDFYTGVDLVRIIMIILPVVIILGYIGYMKFGKGG